MLQRHLSVPQTFLLNLASHNQRWRWWRRENMASPSRAKQNMHFTDETSLSGSGGVSHARKYDWSCVQVLYTHVSWNQDHVKHL